MSDIEKSDEVSKDGSLPQESDTSNSSLVHDNNNIEDDNGESRAKKIKTEYKDPWYKFDECPAAKMDGDMYYTPSYFLRTHSKNNNTADVQTQIWQCCFPPSSCIGKTITKKVVATCGGSSVCFIDVTTGEVLLKYNRSTKAVVSENLYALAWSSLEVISDEHVDLNAPEELFGTNSPNCQRGSVVAAAGGKSTVVLVDVEAGYCYHMFRTVPNKATAIVCSLLFHPKRQSWLFCGHEDGHIQIWDIGLLSRPYYSQSSKCQPLMTLPNVSGDVYNLQFSQTLDLLIAGCDSSLLVYDVDPNKVINGEKIPVTKVELPMPGDTSSSVVDSIVLVRDTVLAAKCALHGSIYVMDLNMILKRRSTTTAHKNADMFAKVDFSDVVSLKFSDTDNYYMNMGADPKSCVVVCGDDKGTLWLYDLHDVITGKTPSPLTGGDVAGDTQPIPPDVKLMWPNLDDPEVEKAGKLRLDSYDIVVDKCCVSEGADHVVAVTNNNMVCIWSRSNAPDEDDGETEEDQKQEDDDRDEDEEE